MSLSLTITKEIDKVIQTFIKKVSDKYNLDNTELKNIWEGNQVKEFNIDSKQNIVDSSPIKDQLHPPKIDYDVLLKCTKHELIALCKTHNHKCSGTKSILMNRLLGKDDSKDVIKDDSKNDSKNKVTKTKVVTQKATNNTPVVKKLTANIPDILIRRNSFNNYEHPTTGLVFDNEKKIVIGKQKDDGSVSILTDDDIDKCNAYKFKFNIPNNLDQQSSLVNVKIDELDEDEEEDVDYDEEEEEEEDLVDDLVDEDLVEEDLVDVDEDEDDALGYDEEYVTDDE